MNMFNAFNIYMCLTHRDGKQMVCFKLPETTSNPLFLGTTTAVLNKNQPHLNYADQELPVYVMNTVYVYSTLLTS